MIDQLPPAEAIEIPTTAVDVSVFGGRGLLVGWAFSETTGAARADFVLRDGNTANAKLLLPLSLAPGESRVDLTPGAGIRVDSGVLLDMTAGSVQGDLYVILEDYLTQEQSDAIWRRSRMWGDPA